MEKKNKNKKGLSEIVLIAIVSICLLLIVSEISSNIINQVESSASADQVVIEVEEVTPTVIPTLTEEEYNEMFGIENAGNQGVP